MVGARPRFLYRTILLLAATVSTVPPSLCQSYDELARVLAEKVAAALKPREAASISFRNISSMSPQDAAAAQTAIERQLRTLGVGSAEPGQPPVEVSVTLSEDLRGWIWVAEIRRDAAREVLMEARPKPAATAGAASLVIDKKLLFEEEQRMLDLAPLPGALLVLGAETVSVYENDGSRWQRKLSAPIPASRPWPRDLRGRIFVQSNAQGGLYQAYLPGLACNGNAASGLSVTCREDSLWPIGSGPSMLGFARFAPARNFFDGRIVTPNGSQKNLPAFYSAAGFADGGRTAWALAGADGRTHLYSAALEHTGAWAGWGSEMAGVESVCGSRSQVLATAPGDDTAADSVQAYELIDGAPRPAGDAVTFSGPVTALWPSPERGVAYAISRDLRSGRYAAFRLAITCSH